MKQANSSSPCGVPHLAAQWMTPCAADLRYSGVVAMLVLLLAINNHRHGQVMRGW